MYKKLVPFGIAVLIALSTSAYAQSKKDQTSMDRLLNSVTRPKLIPYTDGTKKLGFMDSITHNIVVPAIYDQANHFYNGMALIRLGNKYGFVREDGKIIAPKYDMVTLFSEGLSAVFNGTVTKNAQNDITDLKGLWGYIDKNGNEVIGLNYLNALPFEDGLGSVNMDNHVGYINKSGKIAIPFIYQDGNSFKNGKARVKQHNQWIYINVLGETITDTLSTAKLPKYYDNIGEVITLGDVEEISQYLSQDVDLNAKCNGKLPVEYVFDRRKTDKLSIFKLLIDKGIDVNATSTYNGPLIIMVGRYGYIDFDLYEALKLLMEKHVNVNATNNYKSTLLHLLCSDVASEQNITMVKLLIENGADLNLQDDYKQTPLQIAKKNKRNDIVELIKNAQKK